ncbi:MAG TPA: alpha/beta fold hydrolase BchO [Pseudohaliea sp.]|nr:alpha/beta fold hydrolase BchO [Pseudohaliea sp.]
MIAEIRDDWPNRSASRYVDAGGLRWHVQSLGDAGPVLLLLHGTGAATHSWAGLAPLLATRFRVIAPDLPGHGYTDYHPDACSLPGMAAAVSALLEALALAPALLVGHSAGAAVAARLALDGGVSPAAIVSLNGALLPLPGMMGKLFPGAARVLDRVPALPQLLAFSARRRPMMDLFIEQTGSASDNIGVDFYHGLSRSSKHIRGVLGMMAAWELEALEAGLPQLAMPLHLVACQNDRAVPPAQARSLLGRVPGAVLHPLPGLGHLGHEENPQLFADLIMGIAHEAGLP